MLFCLSCSEPGAPARSAALVGHNVEARTHANYAAQWENFPTEQRRMDD